MLKVSLPINVKTKEITICSCVETELILNSGYVMSLEINIDESSSGLKITLGLLVTTLVPFPGTHFFEI